MTIERCAGSLSAARLGSHGRPVGTAHASQVAMLTSEAYDAVRRFGLSIASVMLLAGCGGESTSAAPGAGGDAADTSSVGEDVLAFRRHREKSHRAPAEDRDELRCPDAAAEGIGDSAGDSDEQGIAPDTDASDAATGCLVDGTYSMAATGTSCGWFTTTPTSCVALTPVCTSLVATIQIHVINDPAMGWIARYSGPPQSQSFAFSLTPPFSGFPYFDGDYPLVATGSGFSASSAVGQAGCYSFPSPPFLAEGSMTFAIDCATGQASLSGSCVNGWPDQCAISPNYWASFSGSSSAPGVGN
jgi:hypothetical protein